MTLTGAVDGELQPDSSSSPGRQALARPSVPELSGAFRHHTMLVHGRMPGTRGPSPAGSAVWGEAEF